MSGRDDQENLHWVDGAPPPRGFQTDLPPAPMPTGRLPAPPASPVNRLTPAQIIRAEALRCATAGGPRNPHNAIQDAKIFEKWIKEGI